MQNLSDKPKGIQYHPLHDPTSPRQVDGTMRKYQQLALTIITIVSLVAFLFYKHEYERLRYTLEYLDTFGEAPSKGEVIRPQCGYNTHHKVSTPPTDWVQVTSDLAVYSSFWDEQNGIGEPQIRTIAAVRKSTETPEDLSCLIWFESEDAPVPGTCSVEFASERAHGQTTVEEDIGVLYILCTADSKKLMLSKTPYMIQFKVGSSEPSQPVFIHESDSLKSVINKSAVCVLPVESPVATLKVIEFISFYNIIGVDKFSIYGLVLTPLARKLLDKYSDEIGFEYEEKLFSSSQNFKLTRPIVKRIIELDCIYRHKDTQENVLILDLDQYVMLELKATLQETLLALKGGNHHYRDVAEFHLTTQKVCLDMEHMRKGTLLLSQQVRTVGRMKEMGVAVLRPHFLTASSFGIAGGSPPVSQHISAATVIVHEYSDCASTDNHDDRVHLPTYKKFVDKLEKSLLYRKWIINQ
ncbi:hypothetical protein OTU49_007291 [Cherax quadricarinatus]|uniref:Glycosyltransferase family 92 protein n=1 Tax=Cherax quadricarinatus TaxID=27406 RepID=A0AAW0WI82_CHEQU|nr:uncharacterized protein LOC128698765 [Cherax quadricarinatus]XP_053647106.1 uncharacterized protein LOC128698765 [Cherax quadricarinatus]XP_053647107.1 uncharacterized protein LOC128698765 [Cherax quadricarinatus]